MKDKESQFLSKLFASSSDQADQSEVDFPLVDVPPRLSENLYAISDSQIDSSPQAKPLLFKSWPKITSIAASVLVAVVLFQVYQQQQTLKQLEQAQADLATALHYLGEANKITQANTINSFNSNMKKAAVEPVVEIGRGSLFPNLKSLETKSNTPSRSL